MKLLFLPLLLITLICASCKVAEKNFREGNYDQTIDICVKKLVNHPSKEKYSLLLEDAFARENAADLEKIKALHLEGQPDRWEDVYNIYQNIGRRQHKIEPLIPLHIASQNRDAKFELIDIVAAIVEAKKHAAEFWYADAAQKLGANNAFMARDAYDELIKLKNFFDHYKDVDDLLIRAKKEGTIEVLFKVVNNADKILSPPIDQGIKSIIPAATTGDWYHITSQTKANVKYVMSVVLDIQQIDAFPEKINSSSHEETKQVENGTTYVYDANGNVVKDSTGHPVLVKAYKTIKAIVTETWQEKSSLISGQIKYNNNMNGVFLRVVPVKGEGSFKNYYATATGNYDALSEESKKKLGGKAAPYPSDEAMLNMAIVTLQESVQNVMRENNSVLNKN